MQPPNLAALLRRVVHQDGCWVWTGRRSPLGYARIGEYLAHRECWRLHFGEPLASQSVVQLCGNRACLNPEHLRVGKQNYRKAEAPDVRFWRLVLKGDGCWTWQAHRLRRGYGLFALGHRKNVQAHRYAWEITNGPIADGLLVCHRCDNPPCVRPDHLFLGTPKDNADDRDTKGRTWNGKGPRPAALEGKCF